MTKLQDGVLEIQEVKADPISIQKKLLILAGLIITAFVLKRVSSEMLLFLIISLVGSSLTGWIGSVLLPLPLLGYDFKTFLIVAIVNFINSIIYKNLVFKYKNKSFQLILAYFLQSLVYLHLLLFLNSPSAFFTFYLENLGYLFPLTLISTGIFTVLPKSWRQPLW